MVRLTSLLLLLLLIFVTVADEFIFYTVFAFSQETNNPYGTNYIMHHVMNPNYCVQMITDGIISVQFHYIPYS